jgi:S1-C subfamily serine protease
MKPAFALLLGLGLLACNTHAADAKAPARSAPVFPTLDLSGAFNDREIDRRIAEVGGDWIEASRSTPTKELIAQLTRTKTKFKPLTAPRKKLTPEELFAQSRAGVLVVAGIYKCGRCEHWHAGGGSGVMLSADGVFATAYHVVNQPTNATLVILTGDGRLAPVREVLAANRRSDIALLRAEGKGFRALPLSTNAPVGSPVCVISHPDDHFFSLSLGHVSRYYLPGTSRSRPDLTFMAITADFAKGSSGGPVFNELGAVVGLVSSTVSAYYNEDKDHHKDNLQMVFKNCTTTRHLLELLE